MERARCSSCIASKSAQSLLFAKEVAVEWPEGEERIREALVGVPLVVDIFLVCCDFALIE